MPMKNLAAIVQLLLAGIFGIVGIWSAVTLAPWAFVGRGGPDYVWLVICCSPFLVATVLLATGLFTLRRRARVHSPVAEAEMRAEAAEAEAARLRDLLDKLRREQAGDEETGIRE